MSKIMRIVVMFDLPTQTKEQKDSYIKFRRNLIQNGYVMLQYSVYTKICNGHDSAERWINKINDCLPKEGQVRVIVVTNKQFEQMYHMAGEKTEQEININSEQITFL